MLNNTYVTWTYFCTKFLHGRLGPGWHGFEGYGYVNCRSRDNAGLHLAGIWGLQQGLVLGFNAKAVTSWDNHEGFPIVQRFLSLALVKYCGKRENLAELLTPACK